MICCNKVLILFNAGYIHIETAGDGSRDFVQILRDTTQVQETKVFSDIGNFRYCEPGYVTDEGYWFYHNKEWKNMTELETVNAVWKLCGRPGVRIGGTVV